MAADKPAINYLPQGGQVQPGSITKPSPSDFSRLLERDFIPGDINVRDQVAPRIGKKDVPMELTRRIPWSKIAGVAARALPFLSTAIAIKEIWDDVRAFPDGTVDEGNNQEQIPEYWANYPSSPPERISSDTRAGFCSAYAARWSQAATGVTYTVFSMNDSTNSCTLQKTTRNTSGAVVSVTYQTVGYSVSSQLGCPTASGGSRPTPDADGKCVGGLRRPITPQELEERIRDWPSAQETKDKAKEIVEEGMNEGGVDWAPMTTGDGSLSGPAASSDPTEPTTTTTPEGTTTTWNTTNYNITYNNNYYSWNSTTTTSDGTTTTTTPTKEVETCGLPGKPACKMDEEGTPDGAAAEGNRGDVDQAGRDLNAAVTGLGAPTLSWQFVIPIPDGTCSSLMWSDNKGHTVGVNPCEESLVHTMRAILAWFLAACTALYCWRSVRDFTSA